MLGRGSRSIHRRRSATVDRAAGKIHLIGVTNFDVLRLREVLDAGVPVTSNQVQYSPLDTRPEAQVTGEFGLGRAAEPAPFEIHMAIADLHDAWERGT